MSCRLQALLNMTPHDLVTLTGGGGKTSLLFLLGEKLAEEKQKVLLTTTTKMYYPRGFKGEIHLSSEASEIVAALKASDTNLHYAALKKIKLDKVKGFSREALDKIHRSLLDFTVVNEGDGAREMPYKFYREDEPVIPKGTTRLVHLIGCDVLGMRLGPLPRCPETMAEKSFDLDFFVDQMAFYIKEKTKAFGCEKLLVINKAEGESLGKAMKMAEAAGNFFDGCIVASLKEGWWQKCSRH